MTREDKNQLFGCACDFCSRPVCRNCCGIRTATEVRAVLLQSRATLLWCPKCKEANLKMLSLGNKDTIDEGQCKSDASINKAMEVEILYLKKLIKEIEDKNDLLKVNNELVTKRVVSLEEDLQRTANHGVETEAGQNRSNVAMEELFNEHLERENRKKNFMLFKCPESVVDIREVVTNVIKECVRPMNFTEDNFKVYRLGRKVDNKTRPIKVVCDSKDLSREVIHNAKKLKQNPTLGHLSVSDDKTIKQQQEYRNLRAELLRRTELGETNLRIIYVQGTPKIVSVSNDRRQEN